MTRSTRKTFCSAWIMMVLRLTIGRTRPWSLMTLSKMKVAFRTALHRRQPPYSIAKTSRLIPKVMRKRWLCRTRQKPKSLKGASKSVKRSSKVPRRSAWAKLQKSSPPKLTLSPAWRTSSRESLAAPTLILSWMRPKSAPSSTSNSCKGSTRWSTSSALRSSWKKWSIISKTKKCSRRNAMSRRPNSAETAKSLRSSTFVRGASTWPRLSTWSEMPWCLEAFPTMQTSDSFSTRAVANPIRRRIPSMPWSRLTPSQAILEARAVRKRSLLKILMMLPISRPW